MRFWFVHSQTVYVVSHMHGSTSWCTTDLIFRVDLQHVGQQYFSRGERSTCAWHGLGHDRQHRETTSLRFGRSLHVNRIISLKRPIRCSGGHMTTLCFSLFSRMSRWLRRLCRIKGRRY